MKCMIKITDQDGHKIYQGKVINLPFKKQAIKDKCIELFNDDDPCIIHESYAINKFAEELVNLFDQQSQDNVALKDIADHLDFIDIPHLSTYMMTLEVKK
ncbi:MAG: hypothetical protein ACNA7K_05935 [Acholeplasmataceae bacterium]